MTEIELEKRNAICDLLHQLRKMVLHIDGERKKIDGLQTLLQMKQYNAKSTLQSSIQNALSVMSSLHLELEKDLAVVFAEKNEFLKEENKKLKEQQSKLESQTSVVESLLQVGKETQLMEMYDVVVSQLNECMKTGVTGADESTSCLEFIPASKIDMLSKHDIGYIKNCELSLGNVKLVEHVGKSDAEFFAISTRTKETFILKTELNNVTDCLRNITVKLTASDKQELPVAFKYVSNGAFSVNFLVNTPGLYKLSVKAYHQDIQGSPFLLKTVDFDLPAPSPVRKKQRKQPDLVEQSLMHKVSMLHPVYKSSDGDACNERYSLSDHELRSAESEPGPSGVGSGRGDAGETMDVADTTAKRQEQIITQIKQEVIDEEYECQNSPGQSGVSVKTERRTSWSSVKDKLKQTPGGDSNSRSIKSEKNVVTAGLFADVKPNIKSSPSTKGVSPQGHNSVAVKQEAGVKLEKVISTCKKEPIKTEPSDNITCSIGQNTPGKPQGLQITSGKELEGLSQKMDNMGIESMNDSDGSCKRKDSLNKSAKKLPIQNVFMTPPNKGQREISSPSRYSPGSPSQSHFVTRSPSQSMEIDDAQQLRLPLSSKPALRKPRSKPFVSAMAGNLKPITEQPNEEMPEKIKQKQSPQARIKLSLDGTKTSLSRKDVETHDQEESPMEINTPVKSKSSAAGVHSPENEMPPTQSKALSAATQDAQPKPTESTPIKENAPGQREKLLTETTGSASGNKQGSEKIVAKNKDSLPASALTEKEPSKLKGGTPVNKDATEKSDGVTEKPKDKMADKATTKLPTKGKENTPDGIKETPNTAASENQLSSSNPKKAENTSAKIPPKGTESTILQSSSKSSENKPGSNRENIPNKPGPNDAQKILSECTGKSTDKSEGLSGEKTPLGESNTVPPNSAKPVPPFQSTRKRNPPVHENQKNPLPRQNLPPTDSGTPKIVLHGELINKLGRHGTSGHGDDLQFPIGVTSDPAGNVIVCDTRNHVVKIFTEAGKHLLTIGGTKRSERIFWRPSAAVVNLDFDLFVKDDHQIQVFNKKGTLQRSFGRDCFCNPYGLVLDIHGNLVLIDANHQKPGIVLFTQDGGWMKFIDCPAAGGLHKNSKCRFIATHENYIAISDYGAGVVYLVDFQGFLIRTFGGRGTAPGAFKGPAGITVDTNGNLIIADSINNRIQVFTSEGNYMCGVELTEHITCPSGMHLTPAGHLLVTNYLEHCVKVYRLTAAKMQM